MRRFFVTPGSIVGDQVSFQPDQARHIATVLRLKPGDRVVALDGTGIERVVELDRVADAAVTARIVETHRGARPSLRLTLLQGAPKGTKMDDIVRMGTELGVTEFVPFVSSRTVVAGRGRIERWRRIAMESAKQCRRGDVPIVHPPVAFSEALAQVEGHDLVLLLWEEERSLTIAQALAAHSGARRIAVVIGPEGGFAQEEVAQAAARGVLPVTIGPLILRTETSGVVALAMVIYELLLREGVRAGSR